MDRPVQPGDLVTVTFEPSFKEIFKVIEVTPTEIKVSSLINPSFQENIVPVDGEWKFAGTVSDLDFSRVALLYNPEIDIIILDNLDDSTLSVLCRINTYVRELCPVVWQRRVLEKYPHLIHGREEEETWEDYYYVLTNLLDKDRNLNLEKLVEYGRLKLLKGLELDSPTLFWLKHFASKLAAQHGQIKVLEWLVQLGAELTSEDIEEAVSYNQMETLRWLVEHGVEVDERAVITAAANGRINMLEYFLNLNPPVRPNYYAAEASAYCGQTDTLEWLSEAGVKLDKGIIQEAAESGQIETVKWLWTHIPEEFDQEVVESAIISGNPELIAWIKDLPI